MRRWCVLRLAMVATIKGRRVKPLFLKARPTGAKGALEGVRKCSCRNVSGVVSDPMTG